MGGLGSGQRWCSKEKTEAYKRLDILWLKREGCLEKGNAGDITWSREGQKTGNICYTSQGSVILLNYKVSHCNEEYHSVNLPIMIEWRACRFGGHRPYFICPVKNCGKSVQHLYNGFPYFVCRHCLKLAYASQSEEPHYRYMRQLQKITEHIGASYCQSELYDFQKPKGMHWKTYKKLQNKYRVLYSKQNIAVINKFGIGLDQMF